MAEAVDLFFELCQSLENAGEDTADGARSGSETIERINLALLALGKLTDIAADWVIVVQVLQMTHGALGCTNTCDFARNFVCQDGQEITLAADVQSCAAGFLNLSVLPAACEYGTDCDDCGPRATLAATVVYPFALKLVAVSVAVAGSSIELIAGYLKWRLMQQASAKDQGGGIAYMPLLPLPFPPVASTRSPYMRRVSAVASSGSGPAAALLRRT